MADASLSFGGDDSLLRSLAVHAPHASGLDYSVSAFGDFSLAAQDRYESINRVTELTFEQFNSQLRSSQEDSRGAPLDRAHADNPARAHTLLEPERETAPMRRPELGQAAENAAGLAVVDPKATINIFSTPTPGASAAAPRESHAEASNGASALLFDGEKSGAKHETDDEAAGDADKLPQAQSASAIHVSTMAPQTLSLSGFVDLLPSVSQDCQRLPSLLPPGSPEPKPYPTVEVSKVVASASFTTPDSFPSPEPEAATAPRSDGGARTQKPLTSASSRSRKRPRLETNTTPTSSSSTLSEKEHVIDERLDKEHLMRFYSGVSTVGADLRALAECMGGGVKLEQVRTILRSECSRLMAWQQGDVTPSSTQTEDCKDDAMRVEMLQRWIRGQIPLAPSVAMTDSAPMSTPKSTKKSGSTSKRRLQLVPETLNDEALVRGGGFNPLVLIVLRGHRPLSDVTEHLRVKWHSALPGLTKLRLCIDLDPHVSIDQLFDRLDRPETFRIMYSVELGRVEKRSSTLSQFLGDSCSLAAMSPLNENAFEEVLPIVINDAAVPPNDSPTPEGTHEESSGSSSSGGAFSGLFDARQAQA